MKKFNPKSSVYKDMFQYEKNHWWYKSLRDLLLKYVSQINPKKILDAGCGTGRNVLFLQENGYEVFGFDISDEALYFSSKDKIKNLTKGDITSFPEYTNKFDLIYSLDVLGNLEKDEVNLFFHEAHRYLNTGGYLIINTSALPWIYSLHDKAWDIKNRFYLNEIVKKLEANKFTMVKASYRVSLLFFVVLISRILERLFYYNKKTEEIRGDLHKTSSLADFVLYRVMRLENYMLNFINFPLGSSLFIVAQKKS